MTIYELRKKYPFVYSEMKLGLDMCRQLYERPTDKGYHEYHSLRSGLGIMTDVLAATRENPPEPTEKPKETQ